MNLKSVIINNKNALYFKIITSVFVRMLLLIIPFYWSRAINNLSIGKYYNTYYLIIIILSLTLFYYLWQSINQYSWYNFYNKLYIDIINRINLTKNDSLSLGEYTNILNNDVDIICTFVGNLITRIIQIFEFVIIYLYFFFLDIYIFLITIIISLLAFTIILLSGNQMRYKNEKRKERLDKKMIIIPGNCTPRRYLSKTNSYLKANTSYNLFTSNIIYLNLIIIEITCYFLIIYAIYQVSNHLMEFGTILLIYSYYTKIINNFEVFGTIQADYQSVKVSWQRLRKLQK